MVHYTVCVCRWVNPKLVEQREAEAAAALSASLPKVMSGLFSIGGISYEHNRVRRHPRKKIDNTVWLSDKYESRPVCRCLS